MGSPTPELAKREAEKEALAVWRNNGKPFATAYMGISYRRLQELDEELPAPFVADPTVAGIGSPQALVAERGKVHGDWKKQAALAAHLKEIVREERSFNLHEYQSEAIDMILVKISRICTGDPSLADHWDDIAGYAILGKEGHKGG